MLSTTGSLYAWFSGRQNATDRRVANIESLLAVLNERVSSMPTIREYSTLSGAIERLTGRLDTLSEKLEMINKRLDLHEGWLNREGS